MWNIDLFHIFNTGQPGSCPKGVIQILECDVASSTDYLDPAIGSIGRPAANSELLGSAEDEPSKADTLDPTADQPSVGPIFSHQRFSPSGGCRRGLPA